MDIFHPTTTFYSEVISKLPVRASIPQCVQLNGRLYVGNLTETDDYDFRLSDKGRLCISSPDLSSWKVVATTPTIDYGLTTYCSQLVLVGGKAEDMAYSNELWLSFEGKDWNKALPPMPTRRILPLAMNLENPECLVVTGGWEENSIKQAVDVFINWQWSTVQALPFWSISLYSTVHNGNWFVSGVNSACYVCGLKSLLEAASLSDRKAMVERKLWQKFIDIPVKIKGLVSFQQELMCLGKVIYASSPRYNHSWVHVGDMPEIGIYLCSLVLPTKELIVMENSYCKKRRMMIVRVHKVSWRSKF